MAFKLIELSKWDRKEYFDHYLNKNPCSYSMTLNLDITHLHQLVKKKNVKLYPATIYLLSCIVNRHEEFRTAIDENGNVGVFDRVNPLYSWLPKESHTFTNIWTTYCEDFKGFYHNYLDDVKKYGEVQKFIAKPEMPSNIFTISGFPWTSFTGLNLNLLRGEKYLSPIFTTGKYFEQNDRIWLPLAIQIHHAVCDGFHLGRFINDLQKEINQFEG